MVNPSKVLKGRKSKRTSLHDKHKIEKKVREHHRKLRKDQKRNPKKYARRDPGIPNSWPFKQQLLLEQEAQKEAQKAAMAAAREARQREKALARQSEAAMQAAAKMTAQQRREARRQAAAFAPLHDVLADADVVLLVLDARDPTACRSAALEQALLECGKLPVLVLNKSDRVPRANLDGWLDHLSESLPAIPFSCITEAARLAAVAAKAKGHAPKETFAASGKKVQGMKAMKAAKVAAAKAAAAAAADEEGGRSSAVGLEGLRALLASRQRALGRASGAASASPPLSVGIVGFDRVGKRSVHRAISKAEIDGVTLLPLPSLLTPVGRGGTINDLLLRRAPPEYVAQPEAMVESLLARCSRRPLLRHFGYADFGETFEFLTLFAEANGLPPPVRLAGGVTDARAAAVGFLKYLAAGRMPFWTPPPPAGDGPGLPAAMVDSKWRAADAPVASAAVAVAAVGEAAAVELSPGDPEEIVLEAEEMEMGEESEGESDGEEGEEGEEESGSEESDGEEGEEGEEEEEEDDDDEMEG